MSVRMSYRPIRAAAWLLCAALAACGSEDPSGGGAGADAAGALPDLGTDSGVGPNDTGVVRPDATPTDTGVDGGAQVPETGPRDTGSGPVDAGPTPNRIDNNRRDTDCDGLSDAYEYATVYPGGQKTSPTNPDTDGDGIPDGVEAGVTGPVPNLIGSCPTVAVDADPSTRTSPTVADADGDGLSDGVEDANRNGRVDPGETDPRSRDSDGDAIPDGIEDANRNGSVDMGETDPRLRDSDGDQIEDGAEDANRNGMREPGETDPRLADTDGDGLGDGAEDTNHNGVREPFETDPRTPDTDCDGLSDAEELMLGTSPLVPDTDGDGIPDGVELGRTMALAGSTCPGFVADQDPATTTNPLDVDSDMDGVADGVEDANRNGARDAGESNPGAADSDGDGISDGDELAAGTDPNDSNDPNPDVSSGITAICSDRNLKQVDFDVGTTGDWTLSSERSFTYVAVPVTTANHSAAAVDDLANGVAGFIVEMPPINARPNTLAEQIAGLGARLNAGATAENASFVVRQSPRNITSHDGFETAVSGLIDITLNTGPRNASGARAAMLRSVTGLPASDFSNLPANTGSSATRWTFSYQLLVRASTVIVIGAVLPTTEFDDPGNPKSIFLADLTNGTSVALRSARRNKACDPFVATGVSVADFLWMADISGSTDDDRGRIASAAQLVFRQLADNGVDFRMGVVPHTSNDIMRGAGAGGVLRGTGFTRDAITFVNNLSDTSGSDGCEFGLEAVSNAVRRALPRTPSGTPEDPRRIRDQATLAVVYISDEHAQELTENQDCNGYNPGGTCFTGVEDLFSSPAGVGVCSDVPNATERACIDTVLTRYLNELQAQNAIAFGQIIDATPPGPCDQGQFRCPNSQQTSNEPGVGYIEMVQGTRGTFYSPCTANPGPALQAIVDAVSGAASQYQLTGRPISSTIKVGLTRQGTAVTVEVPRDKRDGFDYDPSSNSIFFRGANFRPNQNDRVTISYRVWQPPETPCGGPCAPGQRCDPQLGICTCDQAACAANCGPGQVCNANCQCECAADCGGCGPGLECNQATCACECPADCGGCPQGTVCNPAACACECAANCGGACDDTPLACNQGSCNCQCPTDCGGSCTGNTVCNESTCACACEDDCSAACPGMAECDPARDCQCACPNDCGGACPDGTMCDPASCQCACQPGCDTACPNRQVCDPNNGCSCVCPADCGGCQANERCDPAACRCIPIV